MKFSIIAAYDKKKGIGKNNNLVWNLKTDLEYFQKTTKSSQEGKYNAVIMGINTWKSIPNQYKPLKNRINCILTSKNKLVSGGSVYKSLEDCLSILEKNPIVDKIFIIGGAKLYEYAIKKEECNELFITEIDKSFECDTFFPTIPKNFKKTEEGKTLSENNINFKFCKYTRQ